MNLLDSLRNLILLLIEKVKDNWKSILTGLGVIGFIITSIFYYIQNVKNEKTLSTFSIILNIIIVLLISLSILYYSIHRALKNISKTNETPTWSDTFKSLKTPLKIASIVLFLLFFTIFSIYYFFSFKAFSEGFSYMFLASVTMIIIGVLMYLLIQYISRPSTSGKITYFSLMKHLPFLLICNLYDLVNWLIKEIKRTNKFYFYLLLAQFVLVVSYFLVPYIIKKIYTTNSKLLLDDPVYLDKSQSIGNFGDLQEYHKEQTDRYYSYSISSWVYIDNQPYIKDKREYVSILNYGNKPRIEYNVFNNEIRILSMEGDREKVIYNKNIALQKWNHFVFNYDKGTLDIFINGTLVGTSINMVDNSEMSNLDIGEEKGIQGGICNVVYYPRRLNIYEIGLIYWLFSLQKIPNL